MSGMEKMMHFFMMLFLSLIALGGIIVIISSVITMIRETLKDKKEYEELRKMNERAEKIRKKLESDKNHFEI